ncbi:MAG: hypothetical protein M0C28_00760 [Candidatus Moduliflexus flocculans]|nr:hypothetical protein [Candidatus Moduliflexus flocculans]
MINSQEILDKSAEGKKVARPGPGRRQEVRRRHHPDGRRRSGSSRTG